MGILVQKYNKKKRIKIKFKISLTATTKRPFQVIQLRLVLRKT